MIDKKYIKLIPILLVEVLFRIFRLPLFISWTPFNPIKSAFFNDLRTSILYLILSAGIAFYFFSFSILGFWLSVTVGFLFPEILKIKKNRYLWFILISLPLWLFLSFINGNFPVGSMSFETFFSAILNNIIGSEIVAGILSRFIILQLVYFPQLLTEKIVRL